MLLGAFIFFELFRVGQIKRNKREAVLQKSKLGWIVSGLIGAICNTWSTCCNLSVNTTIEDQLE